MLLPNTKLCTGLLTVSWCTPIIETKLQETCSSLEMQVLRVLSQMYSATMGLLVFHLEDQPNVEKPHPKNAVFIPTSVRVTLREERED